jgi:hypothetical protein
VEVHHPGLLDLTVGLPGNSRVRDLLGDRGIELALHAGDLHLPVQVTVVELTDLLDALHERGELLELRPLVVGRVHVALDLDGVCGGRHRCS